MPPRLERVRDLAVYRHAGEGPQIVLVHGAMDRGAGMLRVARQLRGHRVVRYDRRGYGRSIETGPSFRFADQVEDLRAVVGGVPSVLFGHSYGGVIAMALATAHDPAVLGVTTFEAPRAWEPWWPAPPPSDVDPADAAESFLRHMIGDEAWEALPQRTRDARRSEGQTMVAELHEQHIQRYDPTHIGVPLVVGVGSSSGERAQRVARLTADEATLGEFHRIDGAGHGAPITHAAAVADLILRAHPVVQATS